MCIVPDTLPGGAIDESVYPSVKILIAPGPQDTFWGKCSAGTYPSIIHIHILMLHIITSFPIPLQPQKQQPQQRPISGIRVMAYACVSYWQFTRKKL